MPSRPVRPPRLTTKSPGLHFFFHFVFGNKADGAAEHERVGDKAVIEIDGAIGRRNAHAVAVIAHAGDHALDDAPRRQDAFAGFCAPAISGGAKAKTSVFRIGFGAQADAQNIADDAAQTGARAAVRLERGRMVVRFHFKSDAPLVIETR